MTFRLLRLPAATIACLGLAASVHGAAGQSTTSGTLRWGSGLLDVPVASVLPHLAVTGTYSGFGISVAERLVVTRSGEFIARGEPYEKWVSDGSIAIGLFDRAEVGASIQHYDDPAEGGNLLGGFARISLLPLSVKGLDLAVGARYVTSPTFDPFEDEFRPNRFGYPDSRIVSDAGREFNSNFSPYVVATAHVPGPDAGFLPDHDVSLTAGWGSGLFRAGKGLDFYQVAGTGGFFAGSAIHFGIGDDKLLNLMAEFNGFDLNAGVQVDVGGIRAGAFALGLAYDKYSTFRSRKFGLMGSVAFCGAAGGLCKPKLAERPGPDTVTLPAPPPDTVSWNAPSSRTCRPARRQACAWPRAPRCRCSSRPSRTRWSGRLGFPWPICGPPWTSPATTPEIRTGSRETNRSRWTTASTASREKKSD